jgi:hypothetical protein
MIKNCLRSETDFFHYDIKHKDVKIATAHSLSMRDKSVLFKKDEDSVWIDSTHKMVISALEDWEFADKDGVKLPINTKSLDDLADDYYLALVTGIREHEEAISKEAEGIEKN